MNHLNDMKYKYLRVYNTKIVRGIHRIKSHKETGKLFKLYNMKLQGPFRQSKLHEGSNQGGRI